MATPPSLTAGSKLPRLVSQMLDPANKTRSNTVQLVAIQGTFPDAPSIVVLYWVQNVVSTAAHVSFHFQTQETSEPPAGQCSFVTSMKPSRNPGRLNCFERSDVRREYPVRA